MWLPPHTDSRCDYVSQWVAVKWRWNLTVRIAEKQAIQAAIDESCGPYYRILVPEFPADRPAAAAQTVKYYTTSYDGTVWAVTPTSIRSLSYTDWSTAGFPQPTPAPTDYVKYPWSPTVSAVTFFGQQRDRWIWTHISMSQWGRAGNPSPRHAGWIADSVFYKWETSPQIFVEDVGGVRHALSAREWADAGWEPFEVRNNQGFIKLSWDGAIAFAHDLSAGKGGPITYSEWSSQGHPQPAIATRFPGDQLYRFSGDPTIYYAGPTVHRPISFAEWNTMGQPEPQVRGVP